MKKYDLILDEFNKTEVPFDREKTVLDHFLDCAKAFPDNTAIIYEDRHYTYKEVDEITTRLACRITNYGGQKGMTASVLVPRCEYMPIVPLALLKAGMMYVALDTAYPAERLEFMVEDSHSDFIIATKAERSLLGSQCKTILLPEPDCCREIIDWNDKGKDALQKVTSDDLLTILYTSGTTGSPKGAYIPQLSAIVLSDFMRRKLCLTENDIYGTYCSCGFDVCNIDIFLAMTCGAALCIVPQEIKLDLEALYKYFNTNKVTVTFFPTAIGSQYVAKCKSGTIRSIIMGGEKLLPWTKVYDDCDVYNCYGPTEAFVFNALYLVKGDEKDIPVGKPNDNTHFYILSENGDRVGIGEEGEICIAGPQVSRGYLNLPELTERVFTPNPYATGDYGVLYHTGDLGYYREDGNVMVIGRRDSQVKIRGNRLELKEVEAVVRQYPGVEDAVVDAKTLASGRKVLVAYVVSGDTINGNSLCRFVGEHKPSYMIPSAVMQLDVIPLNTNGKVNRRLLPMPEMVSGKEYVAPRNKIEERLCDAYSKVLGIAEVGIDDDFIELGGDSLSVVGIMELCNDVEGLTSHILIKQATVRNVSAALRDASKYISIDTTPRTDYPIYGGQKDFYDMCTGIPDNTILHEDMGLRISRDIDVERLRQAIVKAFDNHPGLKARFKRNADGAPRMLRNDAEDVYVSVRAAVESDIEDIKKGFVRYMNLAEERPYRIEIITTEAYVYVFMDIHHFVIDGISYDILLNDISDAYQQKPLQPEQWTAYDFALYQEELLTHSTLYDEGKEWYEGTFGSLNCDKLPQPDVPGAVDSMEPAHISTLLPLTLQELEQCCLKLNTTVNILSQCAFARTLGKHTGQNEVLFVGITDGRDMAEKQYTTGNFAACEPVYCKWDNTTTVPQMLQDANKMRLLCLAHGAFPFSHLSIGKRLMSGSIYINQTALGKHSSFCGFPSSVFHFQSQGMSFGISCGLFLGDDMTSLTLTVSYKKTLYTPAFITRFADDFVQTLVNFTE